MQHRQTGTGPARMSVSDKASTKRWAVFDWESAMAAGLAGDENAYRALLTEAAQWLRRFYARRLTPDAVEDAVQEALIALHTRRHTFTPGRPFLPWMTAIARYKWVDSLRLSGRHSTDELVDAPTEGHEAAVLSGLSLAGLLDQIKGAQAEVIRLIKIDGFSVKEVSHITGQSESLVKVNVHRGIAALRALLGQSDIDDMSIA